MPSQHCLWITLLWCNNGAWRASLIFCIDMVVGLYRLKKGDCLYQPSIWSYQSNISTITMGTILLQGPSCFIFHFAKRKRERDQMYLEVLTWIKDKVWVGNAATSVWVQNRHWFLLASKRVALSPTFSLSLLHTLVSTWWISLRASLSRVMS